MYKLHVTNRFNDKYKGIEHDYNKNYTSNISIKTLKEKFYKSDKELLKQFFHEKGFKLNKIFTFNNFIENDWYKEIAYLKVILRKQNQALWLPEHNPQNQMQNRPLLQLALKQYLARPC